MTTQRTPTPWRYISGAIEGDRPNSLYNKIMTVPIPFDGVERANMEFLIRAVNSHDALLEAAEAALAVVEHAEDGLPTPVGAEGDMLRAAIRQAKEGDA